MSESPAPLRSVSPEVESDASATTRVSKRKADAEDATPALSKRAAKRLKSKRSTRTEAKDPDVDDENQINLAIGRMGPSHIADHIARQTKRFEPELSIVELEDRRIPGKSRATCCASFASCTCSLEEKTENVR